LKKTIRIVALFFVVWMSLNIIAAFYFSIGEFSEVFKKSNNFKNNGASFFEEDAIRKREQEIDYYSFKLDSLLDENSLQAELFADKLLQKYKGEKEFIRYLAMAQYNQGKYEVALPNFKRVTFSKFDYIQENDIYNVGLCFEMLNQLDSALHYYKRVSNISQIRIAYCYELQKNRDSAIHFYKLAKEDYKSRSNVLDYTKQLEFLNNKIDSLKSN